MPTSNRTTLFKSFADGTCFLFVNFPAAAPADCQDVLDELGSSAIIGAGVGYRYNAMFRTDLTVTYRGWYELDEADLAGTLYKADVSSLAIMVNGYYDLPVDLAQFKPFVGAGIGWARNKIDDIAWNDPTPASGVIPGGTDSGFAWQLMAGAIVPITDGWGLEVGYRYYDAGDLKKDAGPAISGGPFPTDSATGNMTAHEVTVAVIMEL